MGTEDPAPTLALQGMSHGNEPRQSLSRTQPGSWNLEQSRPVVRLSQAQQRWGWIRAIVPNT